MQHDMCSSLCDKNSPADFLHQYKHPCTWMHHYLRLCPYRLTWKLHDSMQKGRIWKLMIHAHMTRSCTLTGTCADQMFWIFFLNVYCMIHLNEWKFLVLCLREQIEWPLSCLMGRFISSSLTLPQPSIFSLYIL